MTTEQAYFFTVAIINLVFAFAGTRINDPEGKPKSIHFFIIAFFANFISWLLYAFEIGVTLKIISVILSSVFIWGLVVFSFQRCEQRLPVKILSIIFLTNISALSYFTYNEQLYNAFHVSAFFVPLAFCIIGYLFYNRIQHRNPSDTILAYGCFVMAVIVATRSLLLEFAPEIFSATVVSSQVIWPAFSVISGVFALLSFTEEAQHKLQQESDTDQLTGLANRRRMEKVLKQEWSRAERHNQPLSLIMLDVDFFKNYNDHYGHQAGDECLKKVAFLLSDKFKRAGEIATRYGGEEFLLILPNTDHLKAKEIAEEICASVREFVIPHQFSPLGILTVSAGISTLDKRNYDSLKKMVRGADEALYRAKKNGRNQTQSAESQPVQDRDICI